MGEVVVLNMSSKHSGVAKGLLTARPIDTTGTVKSKRKVSGFVPLFCPVCRREVNYINKDKSVGICVKHVLEVKRFRSGTAYYTYGYNGTLKRLDNEDIEKKEWFL